MSLEDLKRALKHQAGKHPQKRHAGGRGGGGGGGAQPSQSRNWKKMSAKQKAAAHAEDLVNALPDKLKNVYRGDPERGGIYTQEPNVRDGKALGKALRSSGFKPTGRVDASNDERIWQHSASGVKLTPFVASNNSYVLNKASGRSVAEKWGKGSRDAEYM